MNKTNQEKRFRECPYLPLFDPSMALRVLQLQLGLYQLEDLLLSPDTSYLIYNIKPLDQSFSSAHGTWELKK